VDSAFLRRMLHDLRAPIRHIRGFNRLLVDEVQRLPIDATQPAQAKAAGDIAESLEVIERAASVMDQLCDSLRDYFTLLSARDSGIQNVLGDLVPILWEKVRSEHGDADASLSVGDDLERTVTGEYWQPMLFQILDNCFRYRHPDRELKVVVRVLSDDSLWRLQIIDNGTGFDERFADKAFQPFERLISSVPTRPGLGLTLVRELAGRKGIQVELKSKSDQGTQVTLSCPNHPEH